MDVAPNHKYVRYLKSKAPYGSNDIKISFIYASCQLLGKTYRFILSLNITLNSTFEGQTYTYYIPFESPELQYSHNTLVDSLASL